MVILNLQLYTFTYSNLSANFRYWNTFILFRLLEISQKLPSGSPSLKVLKCKILKSYFQTPITIIRNPDENKGFEYAFGFYHEAI